jgi:adenylate cyclase
MGVEIERKYLVLQEKWDNLVKPEGLFFRQGYLLTDPKKTIRVRLAPNTGYLTLKGLSVGASRPEFEYEIPIEEAKELLDNFAVAEIEKIRYKIIFEDKVWEIDEFLGNNSGLMIAEIELTSEAEQFILPDFIGEEVTGDEKYYNSSLSVNPFKNW